MCRNLVNGTLPAPSFDATTCVCSNVLLSVGIRVYSAILILALTRTRTPQLSYDIANNLAGGIATGGAKVAVVLTSLTGRIALPSISSRA